MTHADAIEELPEVKRMALHPGDTVVLELDHNISAEQASRIHEMLRQRFPENEVLVVAGGSLKVIGPDEETNGD